MFKKISAALMVIVMTVTMISLSAFASPEKIMFERVDSTATAYVKVNATNYTSADATVRLIAVYTDENDKITAINSSDTITVAQGATETINVTIDDMSATSTLSYYVWDGVQLRTPLENSAPVPSTELTSPDQGLTTVDLEWNEADDDYHGVASYNIYNMGIKVGSTTERSFTVTNQERGVETDYSVKSVDDEGFESVQAITRSFITKNIPTVICAGTNTDDRVQYATTTMTSSYGYTDVLPEYEGLACRVTKDVGSSSAKITSHGFKFSAEYAAQIADIRNFTVIITYFDEFLYNDTDTDAVKEDKNKITMGYSNSVSNPGSMSKGASITTLTGTNQWKTVAVNITDAQFGAASEDSGSAYAKFRIIAGPAVGNPNSAPGLKIYSCSILPTDEYNALMKEAVGRVTDAYINDGVLFTDKAADTEKVKIAGKGAVKVAAGSALECDVTNTEVAADTTVNVEIEYYTEAEGEEIVFTYNSDNYTPITKPVTAAGEWQRVRFELTDAAFQNLMTGTQLTGGADFTIKTSSGNELYIHSVRAYIPQ